MPENKSPDRGRVLAFPLRPEKAKEKLGYKKRPTPFREQDQPQELSVDKYSTLSGQVLTDQQREQCEALRVHLNNEGVSIGVEIQHYSEHGFIAATWRVPSKTGKTFTYNSRCYEIGSVPQNKPKGGDWVSYEIHHSGRTFYVFEDMFRRKSQRMKR